MDKQSKGADTRGKEASTPRCLQIAEDGVETGRDFAQLMSALISDIAANRMDPTSANAICNAGGKLLRIVELQHKYGGPKQQEDRVLLLSPKRKAADE